MSDEDVDVVSLTWRLFAWCLKTALWTTTQFLIGREIVRRLGW
jgi:hypothetical protein